MDNLEEEIESILYIGREVSVYKIPPLRKNEGHRANDWGDLANPLWKGRLRIVEKGDGVMMYFEDPQTVFAKTKYDPLKPPVDAVLDSSRYFVIRVEDEGKKAYIGMGFAERTDSFDFSQRYKAKLNPPSPTTEDPFSSPAAPTGPKKDYSLKEGQTFSINIPGRNRANNASSGESLLGSSSASSSTSSLGGGIPLLPPPPSAPKRR
ncbi:adaptin ear-binding coat-associated protein 1 NECAP-1 [Gloeophyllum trabeum ATCC 11539]|uniref:Adaptin ear-binding coat-associated protein 1 NECAP-1 n=1 Tax=Gloeophyllum trabeum (strain ATCC 11539 / FP-39264 / Madison 617) TaxID=670483 RepID=S7QDK6_GLOTA|nr:adaptin ear-binding coat-associated protein 1 NECAP-1 [Gloeophyllum trabeum ATCC 11539]EPQ57911.1 adaptin ear-binding coat-associated protein 1 NECAP-1 [Gloeophyllum trabeum ATCC 11539]